MRGDDVTPRADLDVLDLDPELMAEALIPRTDHADSHWDDSARSILTAILRMSQKNAIALPKKEE